MYQHRWENLKYLLGKLNLVATRKIIWHMHVWFISEISLFGITILTDIIHHFRRKWPYDWLTSLLRTKYVTILLTFMTPKLFPTHQFLFIAIMIYSAYKLMTVSRINMRPGTNVMPHCITEILHVWASMCTTVSRSCERYGFYGKSTLFMWQFTSLNAADICFVT